MPSFFGWPYLCSPLLPSQRCARVVVVGQKRRTPFCVPFSLVRVCVCGQRFLFDTMAEHAHNQQHKRKRQIEVGFRFMMYIRTSFDYVHCCKYWPASLRKGVRGSDGLPLHDIWETFTNSAERDPVDFYRRLAPQDRSILVQWYDDSLQRKKKRAKKVKQQQERRAGFVLSS